MVRACGISGIPSTALVHQGTLHFLGSTCATDCERATLINAGSPLSSRQNHFGRRRRKKKSHLWSRNSLPIRPCYLQSLSSRDHREFSSFSGRHISKCCWKASRKSGLTSCNALCSFHHSEPFSVSHPPPPLQNSERCVCVWGGTEEDRRVGEEEEDDSFEIKKNGFQALQLCCLKEPAVSDLHLSAAESR